MVFDTPGTIALTNNVASQSKIVISNPGVRVMGHIAPAGGVCVQGMIVIATDDVMLQHLRIRPGADVYNPGTSAPIVMVTCENVVIDHCSLSWGVDGNITIWGDHVAGNVKNVTVQWCILSEGLYDSAHPDGPHSMNLLAKSGIDALTFHHNLLAHSRDRNPQVAGDYGIGCRVDFVNNVIYHPLEGPWFWGSLQFNIVGNYVRYKTTSPHQYDWELFTIGHEATSLLYITDNIVYEQGDTRSPILKEAPTLDPEAPPYPRSETRLDFPAVTTDAAADALALVLAGAGATLPRRDSVDERIVGDVINCTGPWINDPSAVGGWPDLTQE